MKNDKHLGFWVDDIISELDNKERKRYVNNIKSQMNDNTHKKAKPQFLLGKIAEQSF